MGDRRIQTLDGPVSETALRRRLQSEGYEVTRYVYAPGTRFPDHTHAVDKIDAVVSGRFQIVIEDEAVTLGPGDFVHVPRGVRHSAAVIGDEPVVSLDGVKLAR
jgi:quercetin dioxygenase-like cupin family protein